MNINKDLNLDEAVKKLVKEVLEEIKNIGIYLSEKNKVKELADVLMLFDNTNFYVDVDIKNGFEFINSNVLEIQEIYQLLSDTENIEINPFKDLDKCIYYIFDFAIEQILQKSNYLENCKEGVFLTEDIINQILEEINLEKEQELVR